ncbi:MAG: COX15/CtaA family protein [Verrucomicrobiota bacterium]
MNNRIAQIQYRPGLHYFSIFTAISTLFLICLGGQVTSKEAGMAVPDWPTTFGESMFLYPLSKMVGGVFWEHSHRLVASAVGLFTLILAYWVMIKERRKSLKIMVCIAVVSVIIQGLLGGLRVVLVLPEIGIFHAALAQSFFCLVTCIAVMTSRYWINKSQRQDIQPLPFNISKFTLGLTLVIFLQLMIGAVLRHEHAGLSIPDFPLHYGKVIPPLDPGYLETLNDFRNEILHMPPTSTAQIFLHFIHRLVAYSIIALFIGSYIWLATRHASSFRPFRKPITIWGGLIFFQAALGIATVLTLKAAEVATLHVANGATILAFGVVINLIIWQHHKLSESIRAQGPDIKRSKKMVESVV